MTAPVDAKAKPGRICRAYISSTVFAESDTATEVLAALATADQFVRIDNLLSDAKRMDERSSATLTERGRDFELVFTGARAVGFTCKITARPGSTGYDLLKTKYESNAEVALALSSGDIATTGTKSLCFNAIITKFPSDEPDPGAKTHDLELRISGVSAMVPVEVTKS